MTAQGRITYVIYLPTHVYILGTWDTSWMLQYNLGLNCYIYIFKNILDPLVPTFTFFVDLYDSIFYVFVIIPFVVDISIIQIY